MTTRTWLDDELSIGGCLRQAVGLLGRGFRHPWLALLLTTALAATVVGALVLIRGDYAPRFVLRVVEADREPNSMPRLKRQLREYVTQGIFTSAPLLELIRVHGLYPDLMRENPRAALDEFKKHIVVDVYQNYFVEDRAPGDAPRSVRLAVSYRAMDRTLALIVTRKLGALIVDHERATRREQAESAAKHADLGRDTLRHALQLRSEEILKKQNQISQAKTPDPTLQVELVSLLGSLAALERQAEAAERNAATFDLGAALERRGLGLYFEVIDDASLPGDARRAETRQLAGAASFVLGLPFVALAIGAFEPRRGKV